MVRMLWGFLLHALRSIFSPKRLPLKAGERAPHFDLQDETGGRHRLSDYSGRPVILWFFIRAGTPG